MKKRKQNRDWKRIGYELLAFIFFIFLIYIIFVNWQRNEDVKEEQKSNPTVAIIYDKTAEKHLFSGISYIVLLQPGLSKKTRLQVSPGDQTVVSKAEFEVLEIGDTIDGYSIHGVFHTASELKSDYKWFYIVLCFVGIYPFGYICYLLFKIKKFEAFFERHDFGLGVIVYTILGVGMLVFLMFMYREMVADLKNGYEKIYGEDYIETIAEITDHYNYYGSGKDYQRYYYLALAYQDTSGKWFHLTKEVRRNTYLNHVDGELFIKYEEDNPYNAFAKKIELRDALDFFTAKTFFIYCLIVILTALLLYALFLMNRKRRTGSYWLPSDKKQIKV
jgi:hypothetical protein